MAKFRFMIALILSGCAVLISSDNNNINVRPKMSADPKIEISAKDTLLIELDTMKH